MNVVTAIGNFGPETVAPVGKELEKAAMKGQTGGRRGKRRRMKMLQMEDRRQSLEYRDHQRNYIANQRERAVVGGWGGVGRTAPTSQSE
ncbi:unnamed protein product, partial [Amoebophrya sp. A25]|eukprot:GSA25T00016377001.1